MRAAKVVSPPKSAVSCSRIGDGAANKKWETDGSSGRSDLVHEVGVA